MITEVLPDSHSRLWVTVGNETRHVQLHPLSGPDSMLPLNLPRVFSRVRVVEGGRSLRWPGGFTLPLTHLAGSREARWCTHLGTVPASDRFRPLLPLLRHVTPGATLRPQPTRLHVVRMLGLRENELDSILRSYPVPEDRMLHRLHDIGAYVQHHLSPDLPASLLRRPWAYAAHRCPSQQHLHTMLACLTWGRLDLVEDPLWALARSEAPR